MRQVFICQVFICQVEKIAQQTWTRLSLSIL